MTPQIHKYVCPLCEGMCGICITTEGERIISVRPDVENAWSRGHVCPKGMTMGAHHHDPDRLRAPMISDGNSWRAVSWESAFQRVEELIAAAQEKNAQANRVVYFGNMVGKGFAFPRYLGLFLKLANLQLYSSATVDNHPKNLACHLLYGDMWKVPVPDLDNTQLFLIMGANPAASKGSMFSHRDVMEGLRKLRARGGRVIVVDPIRTGTAEKADQWIAIKPGTDAAFLLAVAHVIFDRNQVRLRHFEGLVNGLEMVREIADRFSPERVEAFCGVPAQTIRGLASEILSVDRAAIYGRIGLCTQEFGTLASWMVDVVSILTGNLDRTGGSMWPQELAPHFKLSPLGPTDAPVISGYSRVRGAPCVLGQFSASCLAEEIDTPGAGEVRTLVTLAANPVLSAPGSRRLDAALPLLDCMISVDNYINETTRHAHVILPSPGLLEQPHWDVYGWCFSLTQGGHYSNPVFERRDGPDEWRMLLRLALICGGQSKADINAIDDQYFASCCDMVGISRSVAFASSPVQGPERILDLLIRTGPFGDHYGQRPEGLSLQRFKDAPDGIMLGQVKPQGAAALRTLSGKIELAHPHLLQDLSRLDKAMLRKHPETVLVSRRQLRTINSWSHNVEFAVKGRDRCTLQIHPQDAARIGVRDGSTVRIASEAGEVVAPAEITEAVPLGIVSLPHGWGHNLAGTRLRVANEHPGVNINILTPARFVDMASGNQVCNGIPVFISSAEGMTVEAEQHTSGVLV